MRKSIEDLKNGKSPRFVLWIYPIVSLLILIGLPYLLTRKTIHYSLAFDNTGQIGDTIGGITGPVIALIAGLLTFLAFWVQFQSNKAQTAQFKTQDTDNKVERFEKKFYELLQLHRDNVAEMSVGNFRKGRRVFLSMFDELKFCYYCIKLIYAGVKQSNTINEDYDEADFINIAFIFFFMGVGEGSNKLTQNLLSKYNQDLIFLCNEYLTNCQNGFKTSKEVSVPYTGEFGNLDQVFILKLSYTPFEGHISRLGHYYRHLFQTVKYVVEQSDDLRIDKYEYLKTLRAQLSSHEQLLLYYNSFTIMGDPWIKNNYFTDYRFIKNIPLPLADIGVSPKERLGDRNSKGNLIFEWDEFS